jgi:hypothetical protein
MPRGSKGEKRPAHVIGKPPPPTRREQLLAQAKATQSFEPVAQRIAVNKLIFESVLGGDCTSVEILETAYGDPQGRRYWELLFFEPLPLYQFAEELALHSSSADGVAALDRYLLQIIERLRAAAEAGETWFIGDTSPLITETWSSLALRDSALAVRPREAITWMCQNPNARHLVPETAAQIAGAASPIGPTSAPSPTGGGAPSESDAALNAETKALGNSLLAARPAASNVRRRGRRPNKLEQAKEEMRRDIQEGRQTAATLNDMREKDLASTYRVSRDTARKARDAVLSDIDENSNSLQTATNDN